MRIVTSILLLVVYTGCASSHSNATQDDKPWGIAPRLYTDREAELLQSRLDSLKDPTTLEKACDILGIDTSRLAHPHGVLYGQGGVLWTRLSESYYISLQFQIEPPHNNKVVIYRAEK